MSRPIFSLDDARALLPRVRQLTAEAVIRAEALAEELRRVPEAPDRTPVLRALTARPASADLVMLNRNG